MLWKILIHILLAKMLSSSQIAEFFNHQYHWKESINVSEFLLSGGHQGSVWDYHTCLMCPGVQSDTQICLYLPL